MSESEARRFIIVFLASLLITTSLPAVAVYAAMRAGLAKFATLYLFEYQVAKIANAPREIDTIFVGDSSLGNAIDVEEFQRATNRTALNLALTGGYGYPGTLNMMRRALAQSNVRNVVIMQTIDLPTRDVYWIGYFATMPGLSEMMSWDGLRGLADYFSFLVQPTNLKSVLFDIVYPSPFFEPINRDYIRQGTKQRSTPDGASIAKPFNAEQVRFLRMLANTCRQFGLTCTYAFGPILDTYCRNSVEYIARQREMIRQTGIALADNTPMCMLLSEQGDVEDHVKPSLKAEFTRRYLRELERHLR